MHQYKSEHGVVDIRTDLVRSVGRGHPIWSRNPGGDRFTQRGNGGISVRLEQTVFDLTEDVPNRLALFRQFNRKRGLEVGNQSRNVFGLKSFEI